MANFFTTVTSRAIGTTPTTVGSYSANTTTQATVIGLTLANITGSAVTANVSYNDGSNDTKLLVNAPIPSGGALVPIGGNQKIVLPFNGRIVVTSNTVSSIDATLSMLQVVE